MFLAQKDMFTVHTLPVRHLREFSVLFTYSDKWIRQQISIESRGRLARNRRLKL